MNEERNTDEIMVGDIKIARSVLEKMVRESVSAVDGISGLKRADVEPEAEGLKIALHVNLHHKYVYPEVAAAVQKKVADDINRMTGIESFTVDVTVDKLDFT